MSTLNFYDEPYWDDFEVGNGPKDKNYMRILFRPGYAVQARELTQIQSIIQNQIKQFGNHIFKNGSPVTGGHLTLDTSVVYVKLNKQFQGTDIDLDEFLSRSVYNQTTPKVRAKVIQTYSSATDRAILIKYLRGNGFQASQTLTTTISGTQATILSSAFTGTGSVVSINEGIFYVDGYFVQVAPQTIVLDPYSAAPTYRVGLQIEDDIITESDDVMLLDPAQESFNYQAPGAHRYKFSLVLAKRSIDSVDDSRFFELMRVENGVVTRQVSYPIYSELEKTLARRTYDESGDYTVKPFRINVTANTPANPTSNATFLINVEPGKAYVQGFEYETIGTRTFSSPRARTYNDNKQYNLSVQYGNYIKVTDVKGNTGGIGFSKNYDVVDIHSVTLNQIDFGNTKSEAYYSSRIGTARLKNFDRDSLVDIYKAHLVDVNFNEIIGIAQTVPGGSFKQVKFPDSFSPISGAYNGARISILSGDAAGEVAIVSSYDASTKVADVDVEFSSEIISGVKFSLIMPIGAAKSIAIANTSNYASANLLANVAGYQFGGKTSNNATFIADTSFNKNIFELPNKVVTYKGFNNVEIFRRFIAEKNVNFNSPSSGKYTLTLGGDEGIFAFGTDGSNLSTDEILQNIIIVATSDQAGGVSKGDIIDMTTGGRSIQRVTNKQLILDTGVAAAFNADIYVTTKLENISTRSKTLVEANSAITSFDLPGSATSVIGYTDVKLNLTRGIAWYTSSDVIYKTPEQKQSLYVSDVIRVRKVYDSGNISFAVNATNAIDISDRYTFDSGQNDNYYDHASISLKPGSQPPRGQTCVLFDYYNHVGPGYLAANSYPLSVYDADQIPIYKALNGKSYNLRDCIDLRPIRANGISSTPYITANLSATVNIATGSTLLMANTSKTSNVISPPITAGTLIKVGTNYRTVVNVVNNFAITVASGWSSSLTDQNISVVSPNFILSDDYLQSAKSTQPMELDFQYYLPRIDKVVVTKDKEFKVLTGAPSLTPQEPLVTDGSMPIYLLYVPAYTHSVEAIDLQFIENRRYTMKDIYRIDQRVSVLEEWKKIKESEANIINNPPRNASNTSSKPILGTLVDEYNDFGSADLTQDFAASLEDGKLTTYKYAVPFDLVPTTDSSLIRDKFLCLSYTETPAVSQQFATPEANSTVQTSIIGKFDGFITLTPESDYYYSTEHQPAITDSLGRLYQIPQPYLPISNPIFMGSGFVASIRYAYSSGYYNNGVMVSASQPANNSQLSVKFPDYSNANNTTEPNTTVNIPVTTSGAVDVLNRQWYGATPTLNSTDTNQYVRGGFIDSGDYNNPLYNGLPTPYK